MTIHCLGSINVDHVHRVSHFPAAGETLSDLDYHVGLGGKGANQAIAIAAAGGDVQFVGAVGTDGDWARNELAAAGVDISNVLTVEAATGHAVIYVDPEGENQIVIHGGANQAVTTKQIEAALEKATPGDWWLTQNETNATRTSTELSKRKGLHTAHVAAPFDPVAVTAILPNLDLLAVNEGEAADLAEHLGMTAEALPVPSLLVTLGARGAIWRDPSGQIIKVPAFDVTAVDSTGAGDTFLGFVLAGFDAGLPAPDVLRRAAAAAAISVTRTGAADAIPSGIEVDAFLEERS